MTDDKFFSSLGLRESAFPITREAKDHRWSLQTRPQTQPNTPAAKRPAVEGRMKTELCKHVVAGSNLCPYKERCAFAHSISELKFCKFSDYVADLDEASFFRSRPCFDWVALGSCPFKSRCAFLHDIRIKGASSSTAAFTCKDMQASLTSNKPGLLIDSLYHCRTTILRHGNPLGFRDDTMNEMLKVVCQTDIDRSKCGLFTERICLELAVLMRKDQPAMNHFTFWPTHLLYQTTGCMILQRKPFCIQGKLGKVEELSDGEYEKRKKIGFQGTVFIVHKLAFGPAYKRRITPPSLFFHLSEEDLIPFPPEKIKMFMDSFKKADQTSSPKNDLSQRCAGVKHHVPSFIQYEPMDDCAFNLVTNMMKLRLEQLKLAEFTADTDEYKEAKARITAFFIRVEQEWKSNKMFWNRWFNVPRCHGLRAPQTLSDIVHSNSLEYEFPRALSDKTDEGSQLDHVRSIWKAFVDSKGGTSFNDMEDSSKMKRLSVFAKLTKPLQSS